LQLLFLYPVYW